MVKDKLNRFSEYINRDGKTEKKEIEPDRYDKLATALEGTRINQPEGSFVKIVTDFDQYYSHGRMMIDDLLQADHFEKEYYYNCEEPKSLPSRDLLFFDMETTGLGGAGTIPFLIGFGSVEATGFQVRQYLLPDYPDEEAMLNAVREEFNDKTILVSYNGKSFDLPILSDRLILQRVERNLPVADHIDLLYMARRMYRRRLQSCTLSNIEANILDFHRYDDIPGYLVPSIFFGWLNYDETEQLAGVIKHNLNDIVSLFFLMHHFSELRQAPEEKLQEPDDILSLAKIFDTRKDFTGVTGLLENFTDITAAHDRFDIMLVQSFSYKRSGQWTEAVDLWTSIAEGNAPVESFTALIELAKYYEHRQKDFLTAQESALAARKNCPPKESFQIDLEKRINRLNRKILAQTS